MLIATCRVCDVAGRLGGDEFAVLLPDVAVQAELVARRVLAALAGGPRWRPRSASRSRRPASTTRWR